MEVENFTAQDVDLLYELFLSMDTNQDGKLDLNDFCSLTPRDTINTTVCNLYMIKRYTIYMIMQLYSIYIQIYN